LIKKSLFAVAWLSLACCVLQAQTLTNLTHQPPDGAGIVFLLTDGTVLAQGNQGQDWWKLTPDINGSYINGTWTQVASLASDYDPYAFASQTLADGRVLIEGGEYNFGSFSFTNMGAVYDPAANTWTNLTPPTGWEYIGDSPSSVLPNKHFLIGRKFDMQMADLDPSTMTWTAVGSTGKADWFAEEGWTLMPDGTILTWDVLDNPNSERYIPSQQMWVSDGSTVANLQGPPWHSADRRYCLRHRRNSHGIEFRQDLALYPWDQPHRSWHLDAGTLVPQRRRCRRQLRCIAHQRQGVGGRQLRKTLRV
jgi:hypothetical protein